MARTNRGDCIASTVVSFSGSDVETIPENTRASKVLLQFYTDAAGLEAITLAAASYTPIVSITENGDVPVGGFDSTKGLFLYHMGMYEIETAQNMSRAKFKAFATGYTVYCKINYYK